MRTVEEPTRFGALAAPGATAQEPEWQVFYDDEGDMFYVVSSLANYTGGMKYITKFFCDDIEMALVRLNQIADFHRGRPPKIPRSWAEV